MLCIKISKVTKMSGWIDGVSFRGCEADEERRYQPGVAGISVAVESMYIS